MKKIATILALGILALGGCSQLTDGLDGNGGDFKVVAAQPEHCSSGTRSSYEPDLQNKITDFTIFVFSSNGSCVSSSYFSGDDNMSGKALFVNNTLGTTFDDLFTVYIIANLGDLRSSSDLCSGGVPSMTKIQNYAYSFSDDFSEFNDKGFPMAGLYTGYCPATDSRTLYANKLVTQYNVRFTKSPENPNTYTITGGKLCMVANVCTPFNVFTAANGQTTDVGDKFISADITSLNSGNSASLFVLENEQGTVFDEWVVNENQKKQDNLKDMYRPLCSYAEFYVTVQTPTATYDNVVYRYYFGDGLRDCSIHRNMVFDLTLNFDNVIVEDEGWRIEPGVPNVDVNAITVSRDRLSIIKGMSNTFTVTRKPGVEYDMNYDHALAQEYGVTIQKRTDGNSDIYTVQTTYSPEMPADNETIYYKGWSTTIADTFYHIIPKVSYQDIPVTFVTSDNLVSKSFVVRVNKNPLVVDMGFPNGYDRIKVYNTVDWPENTKISWRYSGDLYGENMFCNNRLLGRYTLNVYSQSFSRVKTSYSLNSGDAANPSLQVIEMSTSDLHNKMESLASNSSSHTESVGSTTIHYTFVAKANMDVSLGIEINGVARDIPLAYEYSYWDESERHLVSMSSSNTYAVNYARPALVMTHSTSYAPAWGHNHNQISYTNFHVDAAYKPDDVFTDSYAFALFDAGEHYVFYHGAKTLMGIRDRDTYHDGYDPSVYYKMNVNGSEKSSIYNPSIGVVFSRY